MLAKSYSVVILGWPQLDVIFLVKVGIFSSFFGFYLDSCCFEQRNRERNKETKRERKKEKKKEKEDTQKETRDIVSSMLYLIQNIEGNPFEHSLKAFNYGRQQKLL